MFQRQLTVNTSHQGPGAPYCFSCSTGPGPGPLVLLRPEEGPTRGESWQGRPESELGNQRGGPNPSPPSYIPLIKGGSQGTRAPGTKQIGPQGSSSIPRRMRSGPHVGTEGGVPAEKHGGLPLQWRGSPPTGALDSSLPGAGEGELSLQSPEGWALNPALHRAVWP